MAAPKTGPTKKNPNSLNATLIRGRTKERMSEDMKLVRDKFLTGIILGMTKYQAAIYCGKTPRSAAKAASTMWAEPYVQERYKELRDAIEEEQLVNRKDIIIGLNREANREGVGSSHAARVAAFGTLSKILGHDAPIVTKTTVEHRGGVMLVPMPLSQDDWQQAAITSQRVLQHDSQSND
jgi:hypothetical protein